MQKLNVLLAVFAGLLVGVLSHYLWPEAQPQPQALARNVVAAQSFVLTNDKGQPAGVFAVANPDPQCRQYGDVRCNAPSIVLYDAQGRELWRASDAARPLTVAH